MARIRLNGQIGLDLAGHVTAQVHLAQGIGLISQVQDHGTSELVVGHARAVGSLEDVNAIPFAGTLRASGHPCRREKSVTTQAKTPSVTVSVQQKQNQLSGHTLLKQNHTRKSIIQVPKVHAPNTALVVELPVNIECFVRRNLELAYALAGDRSILKRRVKLIAPW